jgi:glutaredoxin
MFFPLPQVKKHQQRVLMILDSKNVEYVVVDITEPGKENEKEFMQQNSNAKESKHPLPPQIFNGEEYCGVSVTLKELNIDKYMIFS